MKLSFLGRIVNTINASQNVNKLTSVAEITSFLNIYIYSIFVP